MGQKDTRSNFSSSLGFIMAAAGSAVGLGNIWRFPYLAAKDGGGVFLLCYIVLALTFGFALLTTEIAIGRKTAQSPLTAYGRLHKNWNFLGVLACLVPTLILPYYCSIGGWVFKYLFSFFTGEGFTSADDGYFTTFISGADQTILWMLLFFGATAFVVYSGVNKGIEKYNKILMPILVILVVGTAFFSLTLTHTDSQGMTRTGLQGLAVYLIPDFTGMTFSKFLTVVLDAMGQMFFSISVSMGIMVAYGSYATKDTDLMRSINQIEIFDTVVALLAGMMIIPAVFTFMGTEGMSAGPGLMFVSLPKIFAAMGGVGNIVGAAFFLMTAFAAVTSAVSVMEAITSSLMDAFHISRRRAATFVSAYAVVGGIVVCQGYDLFYFEALLPNGTVGQILDLLDYISNNCIMPLIALLTCVLIGWVVRPKVIIDEVTQGRYRFSRKRLYVVIRSVAPVLLFVLLLQSVGILSWFG